MSKRKTQTPATHAQAIIKYQGYGIFVWPSQETPGLNYSVRVQENRKKAVCNCPAARSISAGQHCHHGRQAIRFISDIVDPNGNWAKPFNLCEPTEASVPSKPRKVVKATGYFVNARRKPPVKYDRPDGLKHRSAEQAGRRATSDRVPDLAAQLMRGTASLMARVEQKHLVLPGFRTSSLRKTRRGRHGRPLSQRVYALVMSHAYRHRADQSKRQGNDVVAREHIGDPPCEGSLGHYFHQLAVRQGLLIWLSQTARAVSGIARYVIVDSTAFGSSYVEVWRESEHGLRKVRITSTWIKAHVLSDAATNVIGAIIPTANFGRSADITMVKGLLRLMKWANWNPEALLGDKGYFDSKLIKWCIRHGMKLFVPLKLVTEKMADYFDAHNGCKSEPEIFNEIYRYRAKIESVFSAWKRMFEPEARCRRSKKFPKRHSGLSISQEIEVLAYAVAYNLHRLATLERILDQRLNLATGTYFQPMPDDWVATDSEVPSLLTRPDLLKKAA